MWTTFSSTLERKGSWEMGLKLDKIDGSMFFFLRRGFTTACLKAAGTQPEVRQQLMMDSMFGPIVPRTSLRSRGGILSEGQVEGLRCMMTSLRWDRVMGWNWSRVEGHKDGMGYGSVKVCAVLRSLILPIKKFWKSKQRAGEGTMGDASRGLVKESNMLNKTWGLWRLLVTRSEICFVFAAFTAL